MYFLFYFKVHLLCHCLLSFTLKFKDFYSFCYFLETGQVNGHVDI